MGKLLEAKSVDLALPATCLCLPTSLAYSSTFNTEAMFLRNVGELLKSRRCQSLEFNNYIVSKKIAIMQQIFSLLLHEMFTT